MKKLKKITNQERMNDIYRQQRELFAPYYDNKNKISDYDLLVSEFDALIEKLTDQEEIELDRLGSLIFAIEAKNKNEIENEQQQTIDYLFERVRTYDIYNKEDFKDNRYWMIKHDYKRDLGNYLNKLNDLVNRYNLKIENIENGVKNTYLNKRVLQTLIQRKEVEIYEKILLGERTTLKEKTIIRKIKNEIENNIKD